MVSHLNVLWSDIFPEMIDLIQKKKDVLLESPEHPLLNTDLVEGLNAETLSETTSFEMGRSRKFNNLELNDVVQLRILLHQNSEDTNLITRCEHILRHIEIHYKSLKQKEKEAGRSKNATIDLYNQVMALFVEYFLNRNDIIFLNTALKIADLSWIRPSSGTAITTKVLHELKLKQMELIIKKLRHE